MPPFGSPEFPVGALSSPYAVGAAVNRTPPPPYVAAFAPTGLLINQPRQPVLCLCSLLFGIVAVRLFGVAGMPRLNPCGVCGEAGLFYPLFPAFCLGVPERLPARFPCCPPRSRVGCMHPAQSCGGFHAPRAVRQQQGQDESLRYRFERVRLPSQRCKNIGFCGKPVARLPCLRKGIASGLSSPSLTRGRHARPISLGGRLRPLDVLFTRAALFSARGSSPSCSAALDGGQVHAFFICGRTRKARTENCLIPFLYGNRLFRPRLLYAVGAILL